MDRPDEALGPRSAALAGPLTYEGFNAFCSELPASTYVVQWGGAHVWKVGGKVFAIGGWNDEGIGITFKVDDPDFDMLQTRPGLRPAPYMATRGLSWIQLIAESALSTDELSAYLEDSYLLVASRLTRKTRLALGLEPAIQNPRCP